MSIEQLGAHFDIHTGGVGHREIHHPNEDAQSRAYLGDGLPWVRYWLHNEFVNFSGEKMSKSKGNVLNLDDLIDRGIDPLAYRLLLLQSHYRSQVRVTIEDIAAAHSFLDRLVGAVAARLDELEPPPQKLRYEDLAGSPYLDELDAALADDLATPAPSPRLATRSAHDSRPVRWARCSALRATSSALTSTGLPSAAVRLQTPVCSHSTSTAGRRSRDLSLSATKRGSAATSSWQTPCETVFEPSSMLRWGTLRTG